MAKTPEIPAGLRSCKALQPSRIFLFVLLSVAATRIARGDGVNDTEVHNSASPSEDKPAPLPLHQIEGNGGVFVTMSAYIVNPPRNGDLVGLPSAGFSYANLGHQENLEALTITESPSERVELGFGWDSFGLGDLPLALRDAGLAGFHEDQVLLYNYNARFQLLKEGEFNQSWIPALTFGAHYKYNDGIVAINHEVEGLLASHGITGHDGVDYTLYASKMFTLLPPPILLQLGGRATKGVWEGFCGFTGTYQFVVEGNVVVFLSKSFAVAAEFKQQPKNYQPIGGLIQKASDWETLDAVYIVGGHLTLAAGYGHFGRFLNHEDNSVWGVTAKWEF
jgi:hypothetical protein